MSARKPQVFRNPKTGRIVDVNSDYKDVLRCYHKASFDSFKRKSAATDSDEKDLKQRNFFRWALENGIVDKVAESIQDIKEDMSEMKQKRTLAGGEGEDKQPKKRRKKPKDSQIAATVTIVQEPKELKIPTFTNVVW
jgi:hypothetical protein